MSEPPFALGGWRVERFAEIDSTSEEARRRALAGDPGRLWVVADCQSAGRGRQGRAWRSPLGNFYGSALLKNPCKIADAPQLGFVAGVAARAALADMGVDVRLKWPNDLVVDAAKLAGILLEGWSLGSSFALAIGVGVNLATHPDDLPYPATDVAAQLGREVSPRAFLEKLVATFEQKLAVFDRGAGFAEIRREWLSGAAALGRPLRARTATGEREGLFDGLDSRGRLLLRREDAIEMIDSADIVLLGATA